MLTNEGSASLQRHICPNFVAARVSSKHWPMPGNQAVHKRSRRQNTTLCHFGERRGAMPSRARRLTSAEPESAHTSC